MCKGPETWVLAELIHWCRVGLDQGAWMPLCDGEPLKGLYVVIQPDLHLGKMALALIWKTN